MKVKPSHVRPIGAMMTPYLHYRLIIAAFLVRMFQY
jgi:hypothetical protein